MDLTEFLIARINEDYEETRAVYAAFETSTLPFADGDGWIGAELGASGIPGVRVGASRAIREVDAKTRILDRYMRAASMVRAGDSGTIRGAYPDEHRAADQRDELTLLYVVRLLALPYADHPDYREEWRV